MKVASLLLGVGLLLAAPVLIHFRRPLVRSQLSARVDAVRRRSLSNEEYTERHVAILESPESQKLNRLLLVLLALFLAAIGVYEILHGLRIA